MKNQNGLSLEYTITALATMMLVSACGTNSSSSTAASNNGALGGAASFKVNKMINRGLSPKDQKIHIELDGTFDGSEHTVTAACDDSSPNVTIVSNSANAIEIALDAVSDSCSFSVQSGSQSVSSAAIALSATAPALNFNFNLDNFFGPVGLLVPDGSIALLTSLIPTGTDLYISCDGGDFTKYSTQNVTGFLSLGPTNSAAILPQPVALASCAGYIVADGIQSPTVRVPISISGIQVKGADVSVAADTDFVLSGRFTGSGETVSYQCNAEVSGQVASADLTESPSQISVRIALPSDTDANLCSFTVKTADGRSFTSSPMSIPQLPPGILLNLPQLNAIP